MKYLKAKKGNGVTGNVIAGVGGLVILVVVILLVVSTIRDADLLPQAPTTTYTQTNETARLNNSGYTLSVETTYGDSASNYVILYATNRSDGTGIPANNYSVNATGFFTNTSVFAYDNVSVTYTWILTGTAVERSAVNNLSGNFSLGIGNVSKQVPTIINIAVIVILVGLVVFLYQRSKPAINGGSGGGSL